MPVPVLKVEADTPLSLHGDIADRPNPAPNATSASVRAAAATAPAAIAGHETPVVCTSTMVVGPARVRNVHRYLLLRSHKHGWRAYSASWFTTVSAILVSVASVFFSSCRVASSSFTASLMPSSPAHVFSVP